MKRLFTLFLSILIAVGLSGQAKVYQDFHVEKLLPGLYLDGLYGFIDFYNGDLRLTHSLNLLTLSGGNLSLGTNNLLSTGSIGATGSRILKGWLTDLELSNLPTVAGVPIFTSPTILNAHLTGLPVVDSMNFAGTKLYSIGNLFDYAMPLVTPINDGDVLTGSGGVWASQPAKTGGSNNLLISATSPPANSNMFIKLPERELRWKIDTTWYWVKRTSLDSSSVGVSASTLLTNLTSAWDLAEITGAVAYDYKALRNLPIVNATPSGTNGMYFDGGTFNNYLGPVDTLYEYADSLSISVWIKKTDIGNYQTIAGDACGISGVNYGWSLNVNETANIIFSLYGTSPGEMGVVSTSTVNSGVWVHVLATYDHANLKLYINGALEATSVWTSTIAYHSTSRFYVGAVLYDAALVGFYNGNMKKLRPWSRGLTSTEVSEIYIQELSGKTVPW